MARKKSSSAAAGAAPKKPYVDPMAGITLDGSGKPIWGDTAQLMDGTLPEVGKDAGLFQKWAHALYGSEANKQRLADNYLRQLEGENPIGFDEFVAGQAQAMADPTGIKSGGLGNTLGAIGANIKAHPWATAGTAALGATNLAGLFDNDRIGGQLIGGGLGAGAAFLLPKLNSNWKLGGLGIANMIQAGGALGSLFDKLKSKQDAERDAQLQAMQAQQYRR